MHGSVSIVDTSSLRHRSVEGTHLDLCVDINTSVQEAPRNLRSSRASPHLTITFGTDSATLQSCHRKEMRVLGCSLHDGPLQDTSA